MMDDDWATLGIENVSGLQNTRCVQRKINYYSTKVVFLSNVYRKTIHKTIAASLLNHSMIIIPPSDIIEGTETLPLNNLEKLVFHVDLDLTVRSGVGNAGKNESLTHLVIIKESLFGLVNRS